MQPAWVPARASVAVSEAKEERTGEEPEDALDDEVGDEPTDVRGGDPGVDVGGLMGRRG